MTSAHTPVRSVAIGLRLVTIAIALASVHAWGRRLPPALVATGLWGYAAAQLTYPLAETAAKAAVLTGLLDLPDRGIGSVSAVGGFSFSMAWLVFGVPGMLFVLAVRDRQRRRPVGRASRSLSAYGSVSGWPRSWRTTGEVSARTIRWCDASREGAGVPED